MTKIKSTKERTNNDLQNIHNPNLKHKTKDRITRTPLKCGGELRCSGREAVPAPLVASVGFFVFFINFFVNFYFFLFFTDNTFITSHAQNKTNIFHCYVVNIRGI